MKKIAFLLAFASLAMSAHGADLSGGNAPPVKSAVCPCGCMPDKYGECTCVKCDHKAPAAKPYDPYGHESYKTFVISIEIGVGRGKLAVGVPDPWVDTYENHCRVESGGLGKDFPDGLYECYRDKATGKAMMVPFAPPKAMAAPSFQFLGSWQSCPNGQCPK